ncbi:hypothetical protein KM043_006707 [Ampulex compressa]|nr:hypothetical protein KM043_006707 [Ampulex compressa]
MFNESKILIIGAGAAGFAAASRLIERGLTKITILEAKDRIGGRIHTTDFSENVVDLGAQWVHGEEGNVVFGLASQYQVLDSSKYFNDLAKHVFVTCNGEIIPKHESEELLKIYYNLSDFEEGRFDNADYSYGEYMTQE